MAKIFEDIVNARDEFAIDKMKKHMCETYTIQFRQYVYQVIEQSSLKTAILKRASAILLGK